MRFQYDLYDKTIRFTEPGIQPDLWDSIDFRSIRVLDTETAQADRFTNVWHEHAQ